MNVGDEVNVWWENLIFIPAVIVAIDGGTMIVDRTDVTPRPRYTVKAHTVKPRDWRPDREDIPRIVIQITELE